MFSLSLCLSLFLHLTVDIVEVDTRWSNTPGIRLTRKTPSASSCWNHRWNLRKEMASTTSSKDNGEMFMLICTYYQQAPTKKDNFIAHRNAEIEQFNFSLNIRICFFLAGFNSILRCRIWLLTRLLVVTKFLLQVLSDTLWQCSLSLHSSHVCLSVSGSANFLFLIVPSYTVLDTTNFPLYTLINVRLKHLKNAR